MSIVPFLEHGDQTVRCWDERPGNWGYIPTRVRNFKLPRSVQTNPGAPPSPQSTGYPPADLSPGVTKLEYKPDHSPPTSVKVKLSFVLN
jgi:hypothetical protein